ncbi:AAA family ATPase [Streptomyces sp. SID4948]|nr:AAA family ATPase [Streptomyces sp. SID4948]
MLNRLFSGTMTGERQIAIISGPVASGKTELLRMFAGRATAAGAVHYGATASRTDHRMPTAVLRQLFRTSDLSPADAARVSRALHTLSSGHRFEPETANQHTIYAFHRLCSTLLDVLEGAGRPLLISVDDVHYADAPSLHCLAVLMRRLTRVPVLLVLTESPRLRTATPLFQAEFPFESGSRRITLGPLSPAGVEALLTQRLGTRGAREAAPHWYAVSGGNPLLLHALLEDHRGGAAAGRENAGDGRPVVGIAFTHAVLSCLHRSDPFVLEVARALAVLGENACRSRVAKLLGTDIESARRATTVLEQTGLIAEGRFRHPEARGAVLADTAADEVVALHSRAGALLYADGADAVTVAQQIMTVETDDHDLVPFLLQGAEYALGEGKVESALGLLHRVHELDPDEEQMATTRSLLARAEWRIDPETALRRLPALQAAAESGHLGVPQSLAPIGLLLWTGDIPGAVALWRTTLRRTERLPHQPALPALILRIFLACLFPGPAGTVFPGGALVAEGVTEGVQQGVEAAAKSPLLEACLLLGRALDEPPSTYSAGFAEKCLHENPLQENTVSLALLAVLVLVRNGRLAMAEHWSAQLRAEAEEQGATSWGAFFRTTEAMAALQRGDLVAAAEDARTALATLSTRSWGIAVGLPLSVLIQACTELDRLEEARACLQVPVPETMFHSTVGLYYLRARGRYHHAAGRYEAALDDFRDLGERMAEWGVDVLPWRCDAARSSLALGRKEEARAYAAEQLARCAPGQYEERAQSLRLLAAIESDPARRVELLEQAVEVLEETEKVLELAHGLADLGRALRSEHRGGPAEVALRRARRLGARGQARLLGLARTAVAQEREATPAERRTAGAMPAQRTAEPSRPRPAVEGSRESNREGNPEGNREGNREGGAQEGPEAGQERGQEPFQLSRAEQRVAELAARGMSNRQIGRKLFITVSTVEQHLTRIYRKLNVNRRDELALVSFVAADDQDEDLSPPLSGSPRSHAS